MDKNGLPCSLIINSLWGWCCHINDAKLDTCTCLMYLLGWCTCLVDVPAWLMYLLAWWWQLVMTVFVMSNWHLQDCRIVLFLIVVHIFLCVLEYVCKVILVAVAETKPHVSCCYASCLLFPFLNSYILAVYNLWMHRASFTSSYLQAYWGLTQERKRNPL